MGTHSKNLEMWWTRMCLRCGTLPCLRRINTPSPGSGKIFSTLIQALSPWNATIRKVSNYWSFPHLPTDTHSDPHNNPNTHASRTIGLCAFEEHLKNSSTERSEEKRALSGAAEEGLLSFSSSQPAAPHRKAIHRCGGAAGMVYQPGVGCWISSLHVDVDTYPIIPSYTLHTDRWKSGFPSLCEKVNKIYFPWGKFCSFVPLVPSLFSLQLSASTAAAA